EEQHGPTRRSLRELQPLHVLAHAEGDTALPHLVHQLVDDLVVEELEKALALLDQRDAHAEGREHRGVLEPDHAATDDGERLRQAFQVENVVAGEDDLAVGSDPGRRRGLRAHRDEDVLGGDRPPGVLELDRDRVRIPELRWAPQHGHVVALELVVDDVALAAHDLGHAREELVDGRTVLGDVPELRVVESARERREHRLPEGLAGNGAGVETHAAEDATLLDDRRPAAELRALHGGALAGWTAPETEKIEVEGG